MKRFPLIVPFVVALAIASAIPCARADLLVGSYNTNSIERYDANTGDFLGNFVDSGSGGLVNPILVLFGPDGYLYVTSGGLNGTTANSSVIRYDGTGAYIDTFIPPGSSGLAGPISLRFGPDGNIYVTSLNSNQVLRYNGMTGAFMDEFAVGGPLMGPTDLLFGPDGNLYVASALGNEVLRYDGMTGMFIDEFAKDGPLFVTGGLLFGPDGHLYVGGQFSNNVLRYDGMTGAFIDEFVTAGSGGLNRPAGLIFGPDGNLYVSSSNNDVVLRYDAMTGAFIDQFIPQQSGGLNGPTGLAYTP
jgi:DNA-binding beta-propeller fold protein YncE